MALRDRVRWRAALREDLLREGDPHTRLRAVIRQLDLGSGSGPVSVPGVARARAIVATGPRLLDVLGATPASPVWATHAAGEAFLAHPDDTTWKAWFKAATASFPFGPGDGCYTITGTCGPGSGCRSGAGTLAAIATHLGEDEVLTLVRAALLPWLDALDEPATRRSGGRFGSPA